MSEKLLFQSHDGKLELHSDKGGLLVFSVGDVNQIHRDELSGLLSALAAVEALAPADDTPEGEEREP